MTLKLPDVAEDAFIVDEDAFLLARDGFFMTQVLKTGKSGKSGGKNPKKLIAVRRKG
ncbi:MAG: hypothetical protein FWC50_01715 [Planctomycetaceae bacterium]|nr:hypothetical protein [Planctomycetaceae bacterium]